MYGVVLGDIRLRYHYLPSCVACQGNIGVIGDSLFSSATATCSSLQVVPCHVVLALEFEPETGTVAEVVAKPNRGFGGDRPSAVQDVRDTTGGHAEG